MSGIERKNLGSPDETEKFPSGVSHEVHLGELTVGRTIQQPGWHWAEHVRPIVGGSSCRVHHTGYVVRGRLHIRHDDNTEMVVGPDDVIDVAPGHDAWVVGDEPFETIDWVGAHRWASPPTGDRVLATIVMTDIVDSTARAEEIGDVAWGRLLERHYTIIRRQLDKFGGREVTTTGDGMLSLFDGAERAVRGSGAMVRALEDINLRIRAGVHTGEVVYVPGNVRGVAVHVASRILALAGPDEVLVSDTTRGLIDDAELTLVDRGRRALKGVSREHTIYALINPAAGAAPIEP